MIPLRIALEGFLSYKERQEIRLDGASVWMLSGTNGSGKSSVFDAITYALFNTHRGGSQSAQDLINHDSKRLAVEFDFRLGEHEFRAERTFALTKSGTGKGSQQLLERVGGDRLDPVAGTNTADGFKEWVRENVGLTYKTFTSSVLLLQGKAERLLDAEPKARMEALAEIVDIERYRKLADKADGRRKEARERLQAAEANLKHHAEVTEDQLAAAQAGVAAAQAARDESAASLDALRERRDHARRWAGARDRVSALRAEWDRAQRLLGNAERVEADARRLAELTAALPHVEAAVTAQARVADAERVIGTAERELSEAQGKLSAVAEEISRRSALREKLRERIDADQRRLAELGREAREIAGHIQTLALFDKQSAVLDALERERAAVPADLPERVREADSALSRADAAVRLLPGLRALSETRDRLAEAERSREEAAASAESVKAKGTAAGEGVKKARDALEKRRARLAQLQADAAAARALASAAERALDEFSNLSNARVCRSCGQPLTPGHFAEELERRAAEANRAAGDAHKAEALVKPQGEAVEKAARQLADSERDLANLREEYKQHHQGDLHHAQAAERLRADLARLRAELPPPERARAAASADFPLPADLDAVRAEAAAAEAARRSLDGARAELARRDALTERTSAARQAAADLRSQLPPGDPAGVRGRHAQLAAEEAALADSVRGAQAEDKKLKTESDRLTRDQTAAQAGIATLEQRLSGERANRAAALRQAEQSKAALPESWRGRLAKFGSSEAFALRSELRDLADARADERLAQLERSRGALEGLQRDLAAAEEATDAVPEDARVEPSSLEPLFDRAGHALTAAEKALRAAVGEQSRLAEAAERRKAIAAEARALSLEHRRHETLAKLLGRERLQLHLLRQAERQIVDHANVMLDRLSSGQLLLELAGGEDGQGADQALVLRVINRATGGAGVGVAFLSGSQRFRVAVSLALGIGQYASRRHRPIESVIIDEGFGCLDRTGRQTMIQELQNLRGHMQCILLVSHQEEFAEAFPDGYHFALEGAATRVSRYQK